jgi:hypothetical protein
MGAWKPRTVERNCGADSKLSKIAFLLVRFHHVASIIVNANHGIA